MAEKAVFGGSVAKRTIAAELRKEDPKHWTQKRVATELGVARETVRDWFIGNGGSAKAYKAPHDARIKPPRL